MISTVKITGRRCKVTSFDGQLILKAVLRKVSR